MPKTNSRKKKNSNSIIYKFLISIIFGMIVFCFVAFICSLFILKAPYPKQNSLVFALAAIIVSSFSASFFHCFRERKNGLVSGLIIGLIMMILFYALFIIFSSFSLNNDALLIIPSSILPSLIAGIIAVNIRKK